MYAIRSYYAVLEKVVNRRGAVIQIAFDFLADEGVFIEHQHCTTDGDLVLVLKDLLFRHQAAVEAGAVGALLILEKIRLAATKDLGMVTGDRRLINADLALRITTDAERIAPHGNLFPEPAIFNQKKSRHTPCHCVETMA